MQVLPQGCECCFGPSPQLTCLFPPFLTPPSPPTPPACQVARFSAEFMRRKLAEAQAATASKKSRKSGKSKAAPAAAAAAAAPSARQQQAVGPPGYAPPPPPVASSKGKEGGGGGAAAPADWEKVPKTAAGKKKAKGKKLDSTMLGFASGTNYSLLEQPE